MIQQGECENNLSMTEGRELFSLCNGFSVSYENAEILQLNRLKVLPQCLFNV